MGDHDAFFKRIFSNPEYAAGELASVLPPEFVAAIDLGKLVLMPGSFVDDAMKQRHTDLLPNAGRQPWLAPCAPPPRRPQRGHPPEACARVGSRASARGPG
ncbi:MAG: Rpn family recombination-promoting nuclease/putative transposase [Sandaracinaceae bacterium]|nr:Rpn family recombination-promoting nuclease/putative transposase [Sandaracinaceae bacterium]